jgi:hypothetical protein
MVANATRLVGAGSAAVALAFLAACSPGGFEGTVRCWAQSAQVVYDPGESVDVILGERALGSADAGGRALDNANCEAVATQDGWFVGIRYATVTESATLDCRFADRFFLHAHPTYSSESGELFPDGSALYVVVPKKNTIVVSASIGDDASKSRLMFSERYCSLG